MSFIPVPKPPLALYQHNYPCPDVGQGIVMVSPPFPEYYISYPLPVTFAETLQSEEFWVKHFQNFGMLRLQPTSVAWKSAQEPTSMWKVVSAEELEVATQGHETGRAMAKLLEMTPAERAAQAAQMRPNCVQILQEATERRRKQVIQLIAEAELCERFRGKPEYLEKVIGMVQLLEQMVAIHEDVIKQLHGFESAGQPILVGK
jgi:hypothetical protein